MNFRRFSLALLVLCASTLARGSAARPAAGGGAQPATRPTAPGDAEDLLAARKLVDAARPAIQAAGPQHAQLAQSCDRLARLVVALSAARAGDPAPAMRLLDGPKRPGEHRLP